MNQKRKYDSAVARIAGNILGYLLPVNAKTRGQQEDLESCAVFDAVRLAREIVAETERTEPIKVEEAGGAVPHGDTQ